MITVAEAKFIAGRVNECRTEFPAIQAIGFLAQARSMPTNVKELGTEKAMELAREIMDSLEIERQSDFLLAGRKVLVYAFLSYRQGIETPSR